MVVLVQTPTSVSLRPYQPAVHVALAAAGQLAQAWTRLCVPALEALSMSR